MQVAGFGAGSHLSPADLKFEAGNWKLEIGNWEKELYHFYFFLNPV